MEFGFDDNQTAIRNLAAQILGDQVDDEYHRRRKSAAFDPALWRILGEAGLTGLNVPEAQGGSELGFIELCQLLEEQGRVLAPVPLLASQVQGVLPIREFAVESLRARLLPGVARGESHLSAALAPALRPELVAPPRARRVAQGWEVQGSIEQVPYGDTAAGIVVYARDEQERDLVLVLEPGQLDFEAQHGTHGEPVCRAELDGQVLPDDALLGTGESGAEVLDWIVQRSYAASAALMLGVVESALRRAADYTMERKQFGRLIASFQAVSHRAANGFIDIEALRASYWQAMWLLHWGRDAGCDALAARWWACEAGHRVAHTGQHLHGGIGADLEFPIHRYFLWAKHLEFALGGAQQAMGELGSRLAADNAAGTFLQTRGGHR